MTCTAGIPKEAERMGPFWSISGSAGMGEAFEQKHDLCFAALAKQTNLVMSPPIPLAQIEEQSHKTWGVVPWFDSLHPKHAFKTRPAAELHHLNHLHHHKNDRPTDLLPARPRCHSPRPPARQTSRTRWRWRLNNRVLTGQWSFWTPVLLCAIPGAVGTGSRHRRPKGRTGLR